MNTISRVRCITWTMPKEKHVWYIGIYHISLRKELCYLYILVIKANYISRHDKEGPEPHLRPAIQWCTMSFYNLVVFQIDIQRRSEIKSYSRQIVPYCRNLSPFSVLLTVWLFLPNLQGKKHFKHGWPEESIPIYEVVPKRSYRYSIRQICVKSW